LLKRLASGTDPEAVVGRILAEAAVAVDQQQASVHLGRTIAEVLAEMVPPKFRLVFRTERGAYSEVRGEITLADFTKFCPGWLVRVCEKAVDCPPNRTAMFRRLEAEMRSLWSSLVERLPTEDKANVGPDSPAAKRFKGKLIEVLTDPITMEVSKTTIGTHDVVAGRSSFVERIRTQAEPYVSGQQVFAKREFWRQAQRSFDVWWRPIQAGDRNLILIAIRYRIGFQTKKCLPGVRDQESLRSQCERAAVLENILEVNDRLSDGGRLVILSQPFVGELLALPEPPPEPAEDGLQDHSA
jgi:hypothetical protein